MHSSSFSFIWMSWFSSITFTQSTCVTIKERISYCSTSCYVLYHLHHLWSVLVTIHSFYYFSHFEFGLSTMTLLVSLGFIYKCFSLWFQPHNVSLMMWSWYHADYQVFDRCFSLSLKLCVLFTYGLNYSLKLVFISTHYSIEIKILFIGLAVLSWHCVTCWVVIYVFGPIFIFLLVN